MPGDVVHSTHPCTAAEGLQSPSGEKTVVDWIWVTDKHQLGKDISSLLKQVDWQAPVLALTATGSADMHPGF